jgi:hypothetical protein
VCRLDTRLRYIEWPLLRHDQRASIHAAIRNRALRAKSRSSAHADGFRPAPPTQVVDQRNARQARILFASQPMVTQYNLRGCDRTDRHSAELTGLYLKTLVSAIFLCHFRITNTLVFKAFSALKGKNAGIVDPSLNLRRQMAERSTRFNSAKNQGISRSVLTLIRKTASKMAER